MLVLSSVANREAHPSPRVLVGETLQVVILIQRHVSASDKRRGT